MSTPFYCPNSWDAHSDVAGNLRTNCGGVKPGLTYGATDELDFHAALNPMHVHGLEASLLHLLGFDHEKLTFRHAGRDYRLTDVHGKVVQDLLL